jgi:hypothetical protein
MTDAELVAEQLRHIIDNLKADLRFVQAEQQHQKELSEARLKTLESASSDHEARIRSLQDGVTSFKSWQSFISGGSGIAALAALIKSFLGG